MTARLVLPAVLLGVGLGCGGGTPWPEAPPASVCAPGAFPEGELVVKVKMPSRTRSALAWVPRGEGPFDIVINLHEFRSNPLRQAHYSTWLPYSQANGVILVAPDGKSSTWNSGTGCCGRAADQGVDDVAFLDALVAEVEAKACTTGRVLVTGIGNGAMLAERWACQSTVPDAVVSVGGSLQIDPETCTRVEPLPLLHYHGAEDGFAPADGSKGVLEGRVNGGHHPVARSQAYWRTLAGEGSEATLDAGALHCATWSGSVPVAHCTIDELNDVWPGAADGQAKSDHALAHATNGAWAWVTRAWSDLGVTGTTP